MPITARMPILEATRAVTSGKKYISLKQVVALRSDAGGRFGWRLAFADEMMTICARDANGYLTVDPAFPLPAGTRVDGDYWTQTNPTTGGNRTTVTLGFAIAPIGSEGLGQENRYWCVMGPGGQHR